MTGQLGNQEAEAPGEERRQLDPVRRGAREPVHEQERRTFAADEIPERGTSHVGPALLEAGNRLCVRHPSIVE